MNNKGSGLTPAQALDKLDALYEQSVVALRNAIGNYITSGELPDENARKQGLFVYPSLTVTWDGSTTNPPKTRAFGRFTHAGSYTTTITRPTLFRSYLNEQLTLLYQDYGAHISVQPSQHEIPYPYVIDGSELTLDRSMSAGLTRYFPTTELAQIGDETADGIYHPTEFSPLSHFDARRVDFSLARLRHYTGTPVEHFQPFVLFTNDHKLAAQLGIGIIYQELSVIDELTVLENLYIGRHLTKKICGVNIIDWREMRVRAAMMLLRVGLKVDLDEKVANLSISHKQMLEIAKTLMLDAKVIIMDEPTSSLTNKEVDYLFLIMNQLRKEGTAIVYISHKLAEIRRICDRYTVMKDGSSVCSGIVSDVSNDDIVRLMVGRELQNRFNAMKENVSNLAHETVFEVRNVTSRDRKKVRDISFSVCRGEILGFAGLVGSGRTELMNCLFGVDKRAGGEIRLNGKDISPRSPLDAVKKGMAYITESRRDNGFFPNFSIAQNMAISRSLKDGGYKGAMGLFHEVDEQRTAENQRELLALKCHSVNQNITELSGGNQQKVLISKWLCCCPEVIIFDEPTRGIDVGAKAEIYKVMRQLADDGKVILMVSSELPEIITVCDRIAVFCEGRLTQILTNRDDMSEEEIMAWALPQE